MSPAFILRFLEDCIPADHVTSGDRMMTKTAQPREGPVQDAPLAVPGVVGSQVSQLVIAADGYRLAPPRRHQGSNASDGFRAMPSLDCNQASAAGTATATRVPAEAADSDAQGTLFPTDAAAILMATQSRTFIAAETPDKDPDAGLFQSRLRCF